jgi:putative ABC transport system permease protein
MRYMNTLWQDLRYGFRMLVKRPGFALVAVFTLALGIGANTAIFSVVNSILLRPLAYPEPHELVILNHNYPKLDLKASVSAVGYTHYREHAKSFEQIMAASPWPANLTGAGDPERLAGMAVSANFFRTLGVEPRLGRGFTAEESQPGRNRVVVLTDGLWRRRFGGDPQIVDKTITLNGENHTVVGVMPAGFQFGREIGQVFELFAPIAFTPAQMQTANWRSEFLFVVARLKPGVALQQAQAEMDSVAANVRQTYFGGGDAADPQSWGLLLTPLSELIVGDIRPALYVLLGAVGFVLLIACANVANLLLARASVRQKEIAVRTALGAGRARVVRQLLTESLLLAAAGGVLGLLLAYWGVDALLALHRDLIPRSHEVGIDRTVLLFTLGVSLATGVLFGLVPALQLSRTDLHETLKEGGRAGGAQARAGFRNALVVFEVAVALVLLVGAGLLVKSFMRLQEVNPGFRPQSTLVMQVSLPPTKYREVAQSDSFYQQVVQNIRNLPGVESVGLSTGVPMSGQNSAGSFQIEGRAVPPGQMAPWGNRWFTNATYFQTMGIPLVRGRYFDERDNRDAAGAAIIDETMARKFWPGEDPVGKRITFQSSQQGGTVWREIVGVVGHVKQRGLEGESPPQYYVPYNNRIQNPVGQMFVVVRTAAEPEGVAGAVRAAIQSADKEMPVFRVTTMEQLVSNSMAQRRFALLLFGVFAAVALLLAGVGLYGLMSYSVTQRTHEIGIRMALGARAPDVLKMVVRQGMTLAGVGLGIGLVAAFGLTRLMKALLFGVSATDPLVFTVIALVLGGVAALASFVPARRATKVDPMVALRYE